MTSQKNKTKHAKAIGEILYGGGRTSRQHENENKNKNGIFKSMLYFSISP